MLRGSKNFPKFALFVKNYAEDMEQIEIQSSESISGTILVGECGVNLEPYRDIFVVVDKALEGKVTLGGEGGVLSSLNARGVKYVEASEKTKTMETVLEICSWLLEKGADRDALVLAVGGGITTDMAGFAA